MASEAEKQARRDILNAEVERGQGLEAVRATTIGEDIERQRTRSFINEGETRVDGGGSKFDLNALLRGAFGTDIPDIANQLTGKIQSGAARVDRDTRNRLDAFRRGAVERAADSVSGAHDRRIARINAQIGDVQGDAEEASKNYAQFLDGIAPGFKEAADVARNTAAAEAAINDVFDAGETRVEARYASTAGRVRAIADSVSGGDPAVAESLNESVFEFKEFIDRGMHLDRTQSIDMFKAASALAVAAAESGEATAAGAGGRDTFVKIKQYEDILRNLIRDRSDANAAKSEAMRAAKEEAARQFASNTPATFEDYRDFAGNTYLQTAGAPASKIDLMRDIMQDMFDEGRPNFGQLMQEAIDGRDGFTDPETGEEVGPHRTLYSVRELESVARWENIIEVGAVGQGELANIYNDSVANPTPGDSFDQFLSLFNEGVGGGASEREAREFAAFGLAELGL